MVGDVDQEHAVQQARDEMQVEMEKERKKATSCCHDNLISKVESLVRAVGTFSNLSKRVTE